MSTTPEQDKDGFLVSKADWTESVAEQLAAQEKIALTDRHWEIIYLIRQFHAEFDSSPAMRALCKYAAMHLEKNKATSIYLMTLFPGSPAKLSAKIAGLPKPANCL